MTSIGDVEDTSFPTNSGLRPGHIILISSAVVTHEDDPLEKIEAPQSLVFYPAGRLFRWTATIYGSRYVLDTFCHEVRTNSLFLSDYSSATIVARSYQVYGP